MDRPEYFEACIWERFDVLNGNEGIVLRRVTTKRMLAVWWAESHKTPHTTRATVGPCWPHIGPDQEI